MMMLTSFDPPEPERLAPAPRRVEPFLPRSTFRLPGVNVGWDQAALVVIAAVSGLGLVLFFRTRFGVLTRAVVDDRDLSQLARVDAAGVTSASWVIGCAFAALSGVLLSPLLGVDAVILTLLVIQAFGAAAVGRLVSLPLTYAGGLAIGVAGWEPPQAAQAAARTVAAARAGRRRESTRMIILRRVVEDEVRPLRHRRGIETNRPSSEDSTSAPARRPGSSPAGASPLRDSAGISPASLLLRRPSQRRGTGTVPRPAPGCLLAGPEVTAPG